MARFYPPNTASEENAIRKQQPQVANEKWLSVFSSLKRKGTRNIILRKWRAQLKLSSYKVKHKKAF
jgi:hypothetical protein